jgi:hypothetical protein
MFLLDGKPLSPDRAFTHDGIQYPANWLRLSTLAEKEAIGITEVPDPPTWDQRFYWGYTASGTLIPIDHAELVPQWETTTRTTANTLLQPSDWYIIREGDNGTVPPSGVKEWRQEVRSACEAKVISIELTTTTDELAQYITYVSPSGGLPSDYSYWPPSPLDRPSSGQLPDPSGQLPDPSGQLPDPSGTL